MRAGSVRTGRRLAASAGIAVLVGAVTMAGTLVATPGPWTRGYVSETGTSGRPYAVAYTVGGYLLALGVGLLGARLATVARAAAALLGAAALLAGTSTAVPCSARCPLPPYETFTTADLVHTAAAVTGIAAVFFAMVALAVSPTVPPAQRRLAGGFAAVVFPLAAVEALGMVFVGRGPLTAAIERVLLVVTVCWLLAASGGISHGSRSTPQVDRNRQDLGL